jgi:iron complex outermembrane receptor protein
MVSLTRSLGGGDVLEDGMVYFRYAEGFLSGSFNDELQATLFPLLAPLVPYDPEHVNNYEVGFKGTFADGRLRLSSAVFFMDYEDKQEGALINNADGRFGDDPFIGIITNAASVDIYGIELELRASPWDGGFVSLDLGYLKNEFGEFTSFDPDAPGGVIDLSNQTIGDYSPEWTLNAAIEHAFQLGNGATLTPQLGLYYQGEYDFAAGFIEENAPDSPCFQDAYTKLRARVTYDPPDRNWQASFFGSNINDERYFATCAGLRSNTIAYRYGRPDTWGLEFVARWGNN